MGRFVEYIDRLPLIPVALFALILAIMPLGQPHLTEKLRMLAAGTLRRPLDWFDLFMHGLPLLLLAVKLVLLATRKS